MLMMDRYYSSLRQIGQNQMQPQLGLGPCHFYSTSLTRESVHFGCGAKMPQSIRIRDDASNTAVPGTGSNHIHWHQIKPNRSEEMKTLLHNIQSNHGPIKAVVFDRFYAEEAFSFRIRDICPDALLVLDMQDIHSLRLGRQCRCWPGYRTRLCRHCRCWPWSPAVGSRPMLTRAPAHLAGAQPTRATAHPSTF